MEEWIRYGELQTFRNLITEAEYRKETEAYWRKILEEEKIEYKFKIEEAMETQISARKSSKCYILVLYVKKEYLPQLKGLLVEDEPSLELKEDEEEELPTNSYPYMKFIVTILILAIIALEIYLVIYYPPQEIGIFILITVFFLIELYVIKLIWKRRKQDESE